MMGEWISIDHWDRCRELERPGIIFEIRNAAGQLLLTRCVQPVPEMPFDWNLPALEFRVIPEPAPGHSAPLPEPPE